MTYINKIKTVVTLLAGVMLFPVPARAEWNVGPITFVMDDTYITESSVTGGGASIIAVQTAGTHHASIMAEGGVTGPGTTYVRVQANVFRTYEYVAPGELTRNVRVTVSCGSEYLVEFTDTDHVVNVTLSDSKAEASNLSVIIPGFVRSHGANTHFEEVRAAEEIVTISGSMTFSGQFAVGAEMQQFVYHGIPDNHGLGAFAVNADIFIE